MSLTLSLLALASVIGGMIASARGETHYQIFFGFAFGIWLMTLSMLTYDDLHPETYMLWILAVFGLLFFALGVGFRQWYRRERQMSTDQP